MFAAYSRKLCASLNQRFIVFDSRFLGRSKIFHRSFATSRLALKSKPNVQLLPGLHYKGIRYELRDEESTRLFLSKLTLEERKLIRLEFESQTDSQPQPPGTQSPPAEIPSRTKYLVLINVMFPFIGFGFLDNAVMLVAGDYIDIYIGSILGISTLAAAGIGNLISDIFGLGMADYVQRVTAKLGLPHPVLDHQQMQTRVYRRWLSAGRLLGITIGCLLGMLPLLVLHTKPPETK